MRTDKAPQYERQYGRDLANSENALKEEKKTVQNSIVIQERIIIQVLGKIEKFGKPKNIMQYPNRVVICDDIQIMLRRVRAALILIRKPISESAYISNHLESMIKKAERVADKGESRKIRQIIKGIYEIEHSEKEIFRLNDRFKTMMDEIDKYMHFWDKVKEGKAGYFARWKYNMTPYAWLKKILHKDERIASKLITILDDVESIRDYQLKLSAA